MTRIIRELGPLAIVAVVVGAVTFWLLDDEPGCRPLGARGHPVRSRLGLTSCSCSRGRCTRRHPHRRQRDQRPDWPFDLRTSWLASTGSGPRPGSVRGSCGDGCSSVLPFVLVHPGRARDGRDPGAGSRWQGLVVATSVASLARAGGVVCADAAARHPDRRRARLAGDRRSRWSAGSCTRSCSGSPGFGATWPGRRRRVARHGDMNARSRVLVLAAAGIAAAGTVVALRPAIARTRRSFETSSSPGARVYDLLAGACARRLLRRRRRRLRSRARCGGGGEPLDPGDRAGSRAPRRAPAGPAPGRQVDRHRHRPVHAGDGRTRSCGGAG